LLSKENIKRYYSKNYASNFKYTVTSNILAQSLYKNCFFFQVQAYLLLTISNVASNIQNIKSNNNNNLQSNLVVSTLLTSYKKKVEKI